ncbi:MAG: hypothetical protein PHE73_00025 [Sulfurovaceae bacterium]|nr:hypothetical protein [Sulfurovaceae bacterium]
MSHEEAIEALSQSELPIEQVRKIFDAFKDNNEIAGMVGMNISRKCSVYDKEQGKSDEMISLLRDLSDVNDMGSRWAVAKNHFTPIDILEKLANDDINLVRALVATNPNTPVSILNKLFSDEKIVRDGLSGNPNTPVKLLKVLASDSDKMVRLRVAENISTPKEVLSSMVNDEDTNVSKAAKIKLGETK